MELCSMLSSNMDRRGIWGRMDTCINMAEPLRCSSETITLLIVYTPIQNKRLKWKKNPFRKISSEKYFQNSRNRSKVQLNLEKETATHSSILAWRIQARGGERTEEPGGCSSWGRTESDTTEWLTQQINCTRSRTVWCFPKENFLWEMNLQQRLSS